MLGRYHMPSLLNGLKPRGVAHQAFVWVVNLRQLAVHVFELLRAQTTLHTQNGVGVGTCIVTRGGVGPRASPGGSVGLAHVVNVVAHLRQLVCRAGQVLAQGLPLVLPHQLPQRLQGPPHHVEVAWS